MRDVAYQIEQLQLTLIDHARLMRALLDKNYDRKDVDRAMGRLNATEEGIRVCRDVLDKVYRTGSSSSLDPTGSR